MGIDLHQLQIILKIAGVIDVDTIGFTGCDFTAFKNYRVRILLVFNGGQTCFDNLLDVEMEKWQSLIAKSKLFE